MTLILIFYKIYLAEFLASSIYFSVSCDSSETFVNEFFMLLRLMCFYFVGIMAFWRLVLLNTGVFNFRKRNTLIYNVKY